MNERPRRSPDSPDSYRDRDIEVSESRPLRYKNQETRAFRPPTVPSHSYGEARTEHEGGLKNDGLIIHCNVSKNEIQRNEIKRKKSSTDFN